MQKTNSAICASIFIVAALFSSNNSIAQYEFNHLVDLTHTSVKDQCMTGTCWSYSTCSFLESEAARISGHVVDISEMSSVRYTYPLKAEKYIRYHGKHQFGPGSLCHDVINAVSGWGICPEEEYTGLKEGETKHDHSALDSVLLATVEDILKKSSGTLDPNWVDNVNKILDEYLGELPKSFEYSGKLYTPESFRDYLGIDPSNYINLSSFTHHPFGASFILEVPDNFSHGEFLNLPIDDLQRAVEASVVNGFTVAWDADVSEKGFSFSNGMAILPEQSEMDKLWKEVVTEQKVTQHSRQIGFEDQTTTDDHLMHIVGLATDQTGAKYFIIKNSWGTGNKYGGFQYVSMPYFRAKTIAVLLHKDAIKRLMQ